MLGSLIDLILGTIASSSERLRVWHRWPFIAAVIIVVGHRANLRRENLFDTESSPSEIEPQPNCDINEARSYDGSFNDRDAPQMGMAQTRFGRNIPLAHSFEETAPQLYHPNPREISNRLLARKEFVPVPHLNLLAAAWIQFMVHDWLTHGKNDKTDLHELSLPEGDDWIDKNGEARMRIPRSPVSPDSGPEDENRPKSYRNYATHWWDASQIYGSDHEKCMRLRSDPNDKDTPGLPLPDGKLWLDGNGMLPIDTQSNHRNHELAGENGNWWIGLSVLHTLFAREHNAIVDRLHLEYPQQPGEWLFQKARLVNSALLAKIHTVEWTPALMDSPEGRIFMRGNFWGLMGEKFWRRFGRNSDNEVIAGIPGSSANHHDVPFSMTEEFTAAYRMHSLLPDTFTFRSHNDDQKLLETTLEAVSMSGARSVYKDVSLEDAIYSLATENPGALVLHNYPNDLRRLNKKLDDGVFMDLAAVDILRDRERGIPRYQEFRKLVGCTPPETFSDITDDPDWQRELQEIYGSVDKVDLLVGTLAEARSKNGTAPRFGFSDTAFRVFIVMASRRLKSDRFFTDDFRPEVYTQVGFDWVRDNCFAGVAKRHFPALASSFQQTRNPFFPWKKAKI
ncbi:MAG: peroxidase family protein [Hyphomicrobiaceae bacterium]